MAIKFWKQLDRKTIYHSDWLDVTIDKIELPDGKKIDNFELIHYAHSVAGIVAINEKKEILLERAYRYLQESFDWEIPGGVVEHDEHHVDAVRRELLEETGYSCDMITLLLKFYPHKATCDQKYYVYYAEGVKKSTDDFQKSEVSEIGFFSMDQALKMIDSGEINESMSIVAIQHYLIDDMRKK
jgi:8-oxo-dGTP pyrophosphatase MutT (NUDIX family)